MTRLKLFEKNNPRDRIGRIVEVLRDAGVIICPTGTTYALACHAMKERAVEQICRLRQINPAEHPLSVVCYDMSVISTYAHISTPIYKLMKRNLPGPFTFILPAKNKLPKIFRSRKGGEIGIRMPDSSILCDILQELDAPLMMASLPLQEEVPELRTNPELIDEEWGDRVDLVIDGGLGTTGETTIVACNSDEPAIVRQGDGVLK